MKYVEPHAFADPAAAAAKIIEIANTIEADRNGRISVGKINSVFIALGGSADDYRSGLRLAIDGGYLEIHRSGSYVKFTQKGADKFA